MFLHWKRRPKSSMVKACCALMSLGCDYPSSLKPIPSSTILQSPHQTHIWAHRYPGITPHYVHDGPCYPFPVSAIFYVTTIHLCSVVIWRSNLLSRGGNGATPRYHMYILSLALWTKYFRFSLPSTSLFTSRCKGCNWGIREQVEH